MQSPPTGRKAASRGLIPGLLRRGLRPAQRRGALAAGLSFNLCRQPLPGPVGHGARAWRGRLLVAAEAQTCRLDAVRGDVAAAVRAPRHAHNSGQQRGRSAAAWPQADGAGSVQIRQKQASAYFSQISTCLGE